MADPDANERVPQVDKNKDPFIIGEKVYSENFEPAYKELGSVPKSLLQFPIVLPFQIPVIENSIFTLLNDDGSICSFHFSTVGIIEQQRMPVERAERGKAFVVSKSRVEMIYATEKELKFENIEEYLSGYFDLLCSKLNVVITAYMLATHDTSVQRVYRPMLQYMTFYRLVPLSSWADAMMGIFLLDTHMSFHQEHVSLETQDRIANLMLVINYSKNPFSLPVELLHDASRYEREGAYREAVMYSQMAVETFLTTLYVQLLMVEGKSLSEAEILAGAIAFMGMVKNEFHKRIGGQWNVEDTRTQVGKWCKNTYLLRNRVAHVGYLPNPAEVYSAVEASQDFLDYVVTRIKLNKKKYPTLQPYFATPPRGK